mmetsp:Transcript_20372/g.41610  ORF Transcript_20372/g.41610 Transcript_20372/m.41610 type:complete len:133 (+) Transcript_20372:2114-2512(+)
MLPCTPEAFLTAFSTVTEHSKTSRIIERTLVSSKMGYAMVKEKRNTLMANTIEENSRTASVTVKAYSGTSQVLKFIVANGSTTTCTEKDFYPTMNSRTPLGVDHTVEISPKVDSAEMVPSLTQTGQASRANG